MQRIEHYALVGDCQSAALVGRDGSIDWLCWPNFDSGACFAALLGGPEHGFWRLAPAAPAFHVDRRYLGDTLILETVFATETGDVAIVDFMTPGNGKTELVRMITGQRGTVSMNSALVVRFGYGAIVPWLSKRDGHALRAIAGPDMVELHADVPLRADQPTTDFEVSAGECITFVLSWRPSHERAPAPTDAHAALQDTEAFWKTWSAQCTYVGEHRDAVHRSLLTLKALTFQPTGGIVAAPTTSLPEEIGGRRNWDYRVCWLRDATLTLIALLDAGFHDEARAWRDWLLRAVAGSPEQLQIMYGLSGERRLPERELPWLPGYADSRPVRVGNAAHGQLQLDVFGEVIDALHQARLAGMPESRDAWRLERALIGRLEEVCDLPDHGIWEVRGGPQHFTHSKVMAWVAFDRAIASAEQSQLEAPIDRWKRQRERLHAEICEKAFDAKLGSFVQAYGSTQLDASLLLLPLVGFLPATDERVLGTVAAIEQRLLIGGFVYRYDSALTDDGLPPGEGAFLACSFWLADNYLLQGRHADARRLFARLLEARNDVGLLAEEYHPERQRQLGNFPQAFSHVALVTTALNIRRAERRRAPRRDSTGGRTVPAPDVGSAHGTG